ERVASLAVGAEALVRGDLVEEAVTHRLAQSDALCQLVLKHPNDQVEQVAMILIVKCLVPI
ncbi:hypothetical protein GN156_36145, partial [bacterium LRH843]|nr:hypothetical protein [bacterium LRH843]